MDERELQDEWPVIDADLDGELEAGRSLELARRLEREPALRAAYEARRALRREMRASATRHVAPAEFRERLMRAVAQARPAQGDAPPLGASSLAVPDPARVAVASAPSPRRGAAGGARVLAWWLSGAGFGAVAASFATWLLVDASVLQPRGEIVAASEADAAAEAVSAHTRSLLVGQPIEVASSDQHTVRPWLSARLNFVPPIVDLAPQGYALAGARRDVIAGEIAATLVYRHGAHSVSVFIQPARAGEGERAPARRVVRGFNVVEMTHAAMDWRLVSDMNPTEMAQFADLLRKNT